MQLYLLFLKVYFNNLVHKYKMTTKNKKHATNKKFKIQKNKITNYFSVERKQTPDTNKLREMSGFELNKMVSEINNKNMHEFNLKKRTTNQAKNLKSSRIDDEPLDKGSRKNAQQDSPISIIKTKNIQLSFILL